MGRAPGCFRWPRSIAVRRDGAELCVVDRTGRIQRFLRSFDGDGRTHWHLGNSWTVPAVELGQPTGIQYDHDGRLIVADTHYQRIRVYRTESGEELRSWGSRGPEKWQFTQVRDVVRDGTGAFFTADFGGPEDRIQKFDATGKFLLAFGTRGGVARQFNRPQGLAIHVTSDGTETLLVADSCNHRIQRFTTDGEFVTMWGRPGDGPGEFNYPYAVAVEPRPGGDIFVVEWQNNRVQRFDADGRPLGSWGRTGRNLGELATPWDVAVDESGRMYVVDFGNHRVQVVRWGS